MKRGGRSDRSFVSRLGEDREAEALVAGIIDLARRLNLTIVAEGIEERRQAEWLAAMGCDYGQGFLYSRPLFAAELRPHFALASFHARAA